MADSDAEIAFLKSMQDMNGSTNDHSTSAALADKQPPSPSESQEDEYDPSNAFPLSYDIPATSEPPASIEHAHSTSQDPSRAPSRASAEGLGAPTKKSRTVGGFIIDDDDEDDEDSPLVAGDAADGLLNSLSNSANDPQRSLSHTPNITTPKEVVSIQNVASQGAPGVENESSAANAVPNITTVIPDTVASALGANSASPSQTLPVPPVTSALPTTVGTSPVSVPSKARLPHDRVGMLEDRIKDDPRGDIAAWLNLISEHQKRNKFDETRNVYEKFFKVFPSAAEQWVAYANMELENNDFYRVEQIFNKSLLSIPNVRLWNVYLDYVRRRNDLTTDTTGDARKIVSSAYEFVLQNVGIDKDAGNIWQDYIQFIRSGPGTVGGNSWQDQQKMDQLRRVYQRAICIPNQAVNAIWKEYDSFEMGLNKMTGRKFLQEKSPSYMSARSSYTELQNITRDIIRTTLPVLPPALGFEGDTEYLQQVEIWKKWINWEKDDPLVYKDEDPAAYKARVIYLFKQALMALRFWPEMWFEAAEFCYQNQMEKEGDEFLSQGTSANPESCLLSFRRADRLELITATEEGEEAVIRRGTIVRECYDKVLDALYELISKVKTREAREITRIEDQFAQAYPGTGTGSGVITEDDENADEARTTAESAKSAQIQAMQTGTSVQIKLLSKTLSFAWISLMRAMRRIQGKGKVGDAIGGSRQVFTDARKRGRLTSDVYVASALIEYHCYKDPAATKIFERGMKLFPEDELFALEYLKHLIAINDITNARAVFETTVSKLASKKETLPKAKPIYSFFHEYESHYGDLSQVSKLEKRMADLFPEDSQLTRFSHRYSELNFDPTAIRPIISPASQARPKIIPSVEPSILQRNETPIPSVQVTNSPKRPLPADDSDNEINRPRKLARGESPLKGAAGKKLEQHKRNMQRMDGQATPNQWAQAPPPASLPREVVFLLSIIPGASTYHASRFKPEAMVKLLRDTPIPSSTQQLRVPPTVGQLPGYTYR